MRILVEYEQTEDGKRRATGVVFTRLGGSLEEDVRTPELPMGNGQSENERIYSSSFLAFWKQYPVKVGKGAAWRAWRRLRVTPGLLATILDAVARQRESEAWTKDAGRFIPHPTTWLNGRRWEDEPPVNPQEKRRLVL